MSHQHHAQGVRKEGDVMMEDGHHSNGGGVDGVGVDHAGEGDAPSTFSACILCTP